MIVDFSLEWNGYISFYKYHLMSLVRIHNLVSQQDILVLYFCVDKLLNAASGYLLVCSGAASG